MPIFSSSATCGDYDWEETWSILVNLTSIFDVMKFERCQNTPSGLDFVFMFNWSFLYGTGCTDDKKTPQSIKMKDCQHDRTLSEARLWREPWSSSRWIRNGLIVDPAGTSLRPVRPQWEKTMRWWKRLRCLKCFNM